jgi:bacteriorhodopsin
MKYQTLSSKYIGGKHDGRGINAKWSEEKENEKERESAFYFLFHGALLVKVWKIIILITQNEKSERNYYAYAFDYPLVPVIKYFTVLY